MTSLNKVTYFVQFDCLDDEVTNLSAFDAQELAEEVLDSTPIGERLEISENDDSDFWIEGDTSLKEFEDFVAALRGLVRYEVLSVAFDGVLDGKESVEWRELRQALLELRYEQFEATDRWGAFELAPVSISLAYLTPENSEKSISVSNVEYYLSYLEELEKASVTRSDVASFLNYFKTEIESFRQGKASRFMQTWFSTELLLTQSSIEFEVDETGFFLKPVLSTHHFQWRSEPDTAPLLVAGDRAASFEKVFWFNPLPKSPYREGSDWHYPYQDAIDESRRRGAKDKAFTHLGFVMTMWYLHFFISEGLEDACELPINEFLEKHNASLEPVLNTIENSKFRGLLDGWIRIPSEISDFVLGLSLPENAREIWEDYLALIGLGPGNN